MNKSLLIVASLALGTTALAQNNPAAPTTGAGDPGASQASQSGMAPQTPAEQGSTPSEAAQTPPSSPDTGSGSAMPPAGGDTSGAMNGGATPPAGGDMSGTSGGMSGATGGAGMQSGGMAGAQTASADTSNYPKCGRGVTDKCVQAGGNGAHHAMGHRRTTHRRTTAKSPS